MGYVVGTSADFHSCSKSLTDIGTRSEKHLPKTKIEIRK